MVSSLNGTRCYGLPLGLCAVLRESVCMVLCISRIAMTMHGHGGAKFTEDTERIETLVSMREDGAATIALPTDCKFCNLETFV